MSLSTTPATQTAAVPRATNSDQARHQTKTKAIKAAPATQSERGCQQVPLPRKSSVDVTKSHACRAKRQSMSPCHACHVKGMWTTQNKGRCHQVPGLPRQAAVNVTDQAKSPPGPAQSCKCHACHAKRRSMSPSARATPNASQCHRMLTLPLPPSSLFFCHIFSLFPPFVPLLSFSAFCDFLCCFPLIFWSFSVNFP